MAFILKVKYNNSGVHLKYNIQIIREKQRGHIKSSWRELFSYEIKCATTNKERSSVRKKGNVILHHQENTINE